MESMLYLLRPARAGKANRSMDEAANILSYALKQQWENCTVYPTRAKNIKVQIVKMYTDFRKKYQHRVHLQNDSWKSKMVIYNDSMTKLFDIYCTNDAARKSQEDINGVPMGEAEHSFLQDMRTERRQYCDEFVDQVWARAKEKQSLY